MHSSGEEVLGKRKREVDSSVAKVEGNGRSEERIEAVHQSNSEEEEEDDEEDSDGSDEADESSDAEENGGVDVVGGDASEIESS